MVTATSAYVLWIIRRNRKDASKMAAELLADMMKVHSVGPSRIFSLAALAAECMIESTDKSRSFVYCIPEFTNPSRPHMDSRYYQYKPDIRDIRKEWVDAVHVLSAQFPDLEDAWRDWIIAYGEMTEVPLDADIEDATRILRELLAAKRRFLRSLWKVLSAAFMAES
ncbi:hypothetical protein B6E66_00355 [Streptomyces maremycinicus]|nr:hypothetical protein B6E66_00355 [Streptomyces sp. B9173]